MIIRTGIFCMVEYLGLKIEGEAEVFLHGTQLTVDEPVRLSLAEGRQLMEAGFAQEYEIVLQPRVYEGIESGE